MAKLTRRSDGRAVKKFIINGKAKYFYSSKKNNKEAEKDIMQQIIAFEQKNEIGLKFVDVSKEWENICYENIEHQSARRYKTYVGHLNNYFKDTRIKSITFDDINRFLKSFTYKGYSSKTIKDQTAITKKIFAYAFTQKYTDTDFSYYIKSPKGKPSETREALTDEEIEIVENSIDCTFGFFAYFLLYTGLRKGEALALQYKDIDFENNIINVTKSVYYKNNTPYIKLPKTPTSALCRCSLMLYFFM